MRLIYFMILDVGEIVNNRKSSAADLRYEEILSFN